MTTKEPWNFGVCILQRQGMDHTWNAPETAWVRGIGLYGLGRVKLTAITIGGLPAGVNYMDPPTVALRGLHECVEVSLLETTGNAFGGEPTVSRRLVLAGQHIRIAMAPIEDGIDVATVQIKMLVDPVVPQENPHDTAFAEAAARRVPTSNEVHRKQVLDNLGVWFDQPWTITGFGPDRVTTIGAYAAECFTKGALGFGMSGITSIGGARDKENPYGQEGLTHAEGMWLEGLEATLRGFMYAGSPVEDLEWAQTFRAAIHARVMLEAAKVWALVEAQQAALSLEAPDGTA